MTLGEIIKSYRKEHDLSQSDFSRMSGLSRGYVSMLEQNKNPQTGRPITLTIDTMQKSAKAMGIDINHLFAIVDGRINLVERVDPLSIPNDSMSDDELTRISSAMAQMNAEGRERAIELVEDLAAGGRYKTDILVEKA